MAQGLLLKKIFKKGGIKYMSGKTERSQEDVSPFTCTCDAYWYISIECTSRRNASKAADSVVIDSNTINEKEPGGESKDLTTGSRSTLLVLILMVVLAK